MKRIPKLMTPVVVAAMTLGACGTADSGNEGLQIVVTTSTLGDLVSNVAGSDAEVEVLVPLGADPHSFSPSSQQVAAMNDADLVVVNGLSLEEGFTAVLEGVIVDGGRVLEIGEMLDPIPFGATDHDEDGDHDEGEDHDHEGGDHEDEAGDHSHEHSLDPHVWMDPLRMAEAATLIAAELTELNDDIDWSARADAYASDLEKLHVEIEGMLSSVGEPSRVLVTNHEALGYFADRYHFDVVGTVIPGGSTLGDPSSEELASLVATMRDLEVKVIFAETTQPSALADAVAAELGGDVQVVELFTGSLGEPGSGAETLVDMLRTNASRIARALTS